MSNNLPMMSDENFDALMLEFRTAERPNEFNCSTDNFRTLVYKLNNGVHVMVQLRSGFLSPWKVSLIHVCDERGNLIYSNGRRLVVGVDEFTRKQKNKLMEFFRSERQVVESVVKEANFLKWRRSIVTADELVDVIARGQEAFDKPHTGGGFEY